MSLRESCPLLRCLFFFFYSALKAYLLTCKNQFVFGAAGFQVFYTKCVPIRTWSLLAAENKIKYKL